MHDRLGYAKEHQADAHTGREEHGEPALVAVIRLAMVRPELDIAISTDGEEDHADQYQRDRQNVEPAGIGDDPLLNRFEHTLGMLLKQSGIQHQ